MKNVKLLAFAGSARKESFNKTLLHIAVQGAESAGADVQTIDLADYPMPMFNQDLEAEQGMDPKAKEVKEMMKAADGFIIACPEYNGSITPLLKNTIDWASRAEEGEAPLLAYRGKTALLVAASPGGFGGMRGLNPVRTILSGIGVMVLPDQIAIPQAFEAFDGEGKLVDEKKHQAVLGLGVKLVEITEKLKDG